MDSELGTLAPTPQGDRWQLTFTRRLAHPPQKVWRALTEPGHVSQWFPADIEGERATGAKLRFPFREDEGPTMDGEMVLYDEPRVLEMRWGDEGLRFELEPDGDGCRLTFVNTFDEQGKAARDAAGWHVCLDALACLLDGTERPGGTPWKRYERIYTERFGPEAATIGPPEGTDPG
jgi:uncharacterized protein YndB with AHSA1/START domain